MKGFNSGTGWWKKCMGARYGESVRIFRAESSPFLPHLHVFTDKTAFWMLSFFFFLILKSLILTCVPKHEPPSHLPPHNISLGHPHASAPSMLYSASGIDWRFNSYMIVYMLECHSPKMLVIQPHVIRHRKIRNWLQTRWLIQTK